MFWLFWITDKILIFLVNFRIIITLRLLIFISLPKMHWKDIHVSILFLFLKGGGIIFVYSKTSVSMETELNNVLSILLIIEFELNEITRKIINF